MFGLAHELKQCRYPSTSALLAISDYFKHENIVQSYQITTNNASPLPENEKDYDFFMWCVHGQWTNKST